MKLYVSPGTCAMAPHMILIDLGLLHSIESVDIRVQPHVLKDSGIPYESINQKGFVPALKLDSGELLTENGVILQYLADLKPDSGLIPKMGTMARYRTMEWLSYIGSDLHKTFGQFLNPNMPEIAKPILRKKIDDQLAYLERYLEINLYLIGESFSVADAYLWFVVGLMPRFKMNMSPYPNLKSYYDRIGARPSTRQMLEAQGV